MNAPSANPPDKPDGRLWQWAGLCIVGLGGFALLAARAPERVRLIGLFAVGFGAIAGWGMAYAAKQFELKPTWRLTLIAGTLIAAAEVGLTLEMWRLYSAELTKIFTAPPEIEIKQSPRSPKPTATSIGFKRNRFRPMLASSRLALITTSGQSKSQEKTIAKSPGPSHDSKTAGPQPTPPVVPPGDLIQKARDERMRELERRTRIGYYLQNRLKLFAEMSTLWATLFWIGEVLLAAVCGAWLFRRSTTAT